MEGWTLGFNSLEPGSILAGNVSRRDIFKSLGISRFDFSLIKMCISLILSVNTQD